MTQPHAIGGAVLLLSLAGCASQQPPPPPEPSPYANATVREGYHVARNDTVRIPTQRTFLVADAGGSTGIAAPKEKVAIEDLPEKLQETEASAESDNDAEEDEGADTERSEAASPKEPSSPDRRERATRETDTAASVDDANPNAPSGPKELSPRVLRAWETYCDAPKGMTGEDWKIISQFDGIPEWVKEPDERIEEPLRSRLRGCSDKAWR